MTSEVIAFGRERLHRSSMGSVDSALLVSSRPDADVGALLRRWRTARRLSSRLRAGSVLGDSHVEPGGTALYALPARHGLDRVEHAATGAAPERIAADDVELGRDGPRLDPEPPQPDRSVAVGRAGEGPAAEVLAYPGVPAQWRTREIGVPTTPLLTTIFRKGDVELRFFSTMTSFGTPHDVTLEELRIECSFPADDATATACRELFGS